MAGFSPRLPLMANSIDGFYALNKNFRDVVKQNLKMLVLTAPGERMMDPSFGVGLRNYLFSFAPQGAIRKRIREQVDMYMSFITLQTIEVTNFDSNEAISSAENLNTLGVRIEYYIENMNLVDALEIMQFTN